MSIQQDMNRLKSKVNNMAARAEALFDLTRKSLEERDHALADEVLKSDTFIDVMEMEMDSICMYLLALKEPYGHDFRYVYSVIKTNHDLERIGDECKTIAKWSVKLDEAPSEDMLTLCATVKEILSAAVASLSRFDLKMAEHVLKLEFDVDALEDRIINNTDKISVAFIAKALERIGDLSTNVSENIIFAEKADDIRHGSFDKVPDESTL